MAFNRVGELRKTKNDSINIKFPLKLSRKGSFQTNDTTLDAIKDDLKVLIQTNHGERLVQFDFGANLRPLIFEQITPNLSQQVEDAIISAIDIWMPFVNVEDIQVLSYPEDENLKDNQVRVRLKFTVGSTGLGDEIQIKVSA